MKIHYKLIEHERFSDAPFMGALISSVNCNFNCSKCFNQNIKNMDTIENDSKLIVQEIKNDIFNQGIIFGGMEWTLQINELEELAKLAKENNLLTMLYTGNNFESLSINKNLFDYIKCGSYKEELSTDNNIQYGIKLATSNQKIYKKGIDY